MHARLWFMSMALVGSVSLAAAERGARSFLADTARAMATMDSGMMAKPGGDVDHDFVQMMVPHHQGAIDMAVAEIRYGHNEQLKRIAQEIIIDQQQEIAAMRLALGQPLPPSAPAPTQPGIHAGMDAGDMK
jgi:uncharacterized protein (DUF305 family)